MESLYDYGSRSGFWRLHDLLLRKNVPCTVFAVGMALQRNPIAAKAMVNAGWEIASHGYRWWDYQNVEEDVEREHIRRTVQIHKHLLGIRPVGMYQGKPNINTRKLVVEEGGFLYDSDAYSDDLPYWTRQYGNKPHLIIPYTLSENDMRFAIPNGFSNSDEFSKYLLDSLDYLVEEGRRGSVAANPGNTGFRIWGCISRITSHFFPCGSRTTRQNLFFSQQTCIFVVQ